MHGHEQRKWHPITLDDFERWRSLLDVAVQKRLDNDPSSLWTERWAEPVPGQDWPLDSQDPSAQPPAVWAVLWEAPHALRRLLKTPGAPTAAVLDGWRIPGVDGPQTPLLIEAAHWRSPALVSALLQHGLNPAIVGATGRTALFSVRSRATLRLLLRSGCPPGRLDNQGLDAPAYWAGRSQDSAAFRATDHAVLLPAWPPGLGTSGWAGCHAAMPVWPPPSLRRELARWGTPGAGEPSRAAALAGAVLRHKATESHAEPTVSFPARRLAIAIESEKDGLGSLSGAGLGQIVLAAVLSGLPREPRGRDAWEMVLHRWLTAPQTRQPLTDALDAWKDTPAIAAQWRLTVSAFAMGLRGRRVPGALGCGDRVLAEAERARWAQWGALGLWACPNLPDSLIAGQPVSTWARAVWKSARARVVIPGEPWLLTALPLWKWARDAPFLESLLAGLHRRQADWAWPTVRPADWQSALMLWRSQASATVSAVFDRLLLAQAVDRGAPSTRRARL